MKKILLIGIFGALTGLSQAASVTIQNPGFEAPDLTGGGPTWTNDLATGGGWINQDGSTNAPNQSFVEAIGGFFSDGAQHIGMAAGWGVGQDTGIVFEANTRYTLTVAVGNRNANFTVAGNVSQYGLVDGAGVAHSSSSVDASSLPEATFADAPALVFDVAAGSPLIGEPVIIGLASAGLNRSHFDNVRLDASPIPEPASGLLAGLAGLMLLRRRR